MKLWAATSTLLTVLCSQLQAAGAAVVTPTPALPAFTLYVSEQSAIFECFQLSPRYAVESMQSLAQSLT